MNERERFKDKSEDQPILDLVERAETERLGLTQASGKAEGREQPRILKPVFFEPNLGIIMGLLLMLTSGLILAIGAAARSMNEFPTSLALPGIAVSAIVILMSLRRQPELHLNASSLTLKWRRSSETIKVTQIKHAEVTQGGRLMLHLSDRTELMPTLQDTRGQAPSGDEFRLWLRAKGVPIVFAQESVGHLLGKEIRLPNFQKQGIGAGAAIWIGGLFMSAPYIVFLVDRIWPILGTGPRGIFFHPALSASYALGMAVMVAAVLYVRVLRRKWAKTSLEFADGGMKVVTEGKGTEVEASEVRCILLETKRSLFGFVKKRLVIETHYGRFIPLTRFQHIWPVEAEQILHQAPLYGTKIEFAHEGKRLVLRREGDEEPLEVP